MPPPRHRLVYENFMLLRYNALGGEEMPTIAYRLRLFNKTGPMWEDAHLGIRLHPGVSLAQTRLGVTAVFKPVGLFSLYGGYYYNIWYGSFGNLRSYSSPASEYFVPDDFNGVEGAVDSVGHEALVGARVVAAVGPFVFSNNIAFYWTRMNLRDGDRYYFQPRHDMLVENNGWFFTNDTDVGFISPVGLTAAARLSLVHAFYDKAELSDAEKKAAQLTTPTIRLGPLLSYVFFDAPQARFNKPTLIFMCSWWLRNRYRTGDSVHQGIPLLVLAFKFEGDIWWRD